jgi:ankyrin repeat protein
MTTSANPKWWFQAAISIALVVCIIGCKKSARDEVLIATMTDNVQMLKQADARGADLNARYPERFDWTPLIAAIYFQSTNVISYLLNRGVDVTKRTGNGDTALMMAIRWDDKNTVALLFRTAPQALRETEDWSAVRSSLRADGGDKAIRDYLYAFVDEFLRTNAVGSSKP